MINQIKTETKVNTIYDKYLHSQFRAQQSKHTSWYKRNVILFIWEIEFTKSKRNKREIFQSKIVKYIKIGQDCVLVY